MKPALVRSSRMMAFAFASTSPGTHLSGLACRLSNFATSFCAFWSRLALSSAIAPHEKLSTNRSVTSLFIMGFIEILVLSQAQTQLAVFVTTRWPRIFEAAIISRRNAVHLEPAQQVSQKPNSRPHSRQKCWKPPPHLIIFSGNQLQLLR